MAILGKKSKTKPTKPELDTLDQAVSELSQQTEALLGKRGEKIKVKSEPKPELPKKNQAPHKNGALAAKQGSHFDIIHNPGKKVITKPTLKPTAAQAGAPALPAGQGTEPGGKKISAVSSLISGHPAGTLHVDELEAKPDQAPKLKPAPPAGLPSPSQPDKPTQPQPVEPAFHAPDKVAPATRKRVPAEEWPAAVEDDDDDIINLKEPPAEGSNELYANNLVSEPKPKGYQPHAGQQKPTVFDTNEYHPPLHDWSKLEHRHRGTLVILIAVLIVAAIGAYVFITGAKLPF